MVYRCQKKEPDPLDHEERAIRNARFYVLDARKRALRWSKPRLPQPFARKDIKDLDHIIWHYPEATPVFKRQIVTNNSNFYLDFTTPTLIHALLSLLAFAAFTLFSATATSCFYTSITSFVSGAGQTGLLGLCALIATFVPTDEKPTLADPKTPAEKAGQDKVSSGDIRTSVTKSVTDEKNGQGKVSSGQ